MPIAKTVLVVEDEADLAELIVYNLQREGHTCRRAYDGDSALTEIFRQPPDAVILDRMLPGMSGDDVIVRIRREPRTAAIPVIMLTAKSDESDELVGFALGADDYITKPFSMKSLLARVGAALRRADAAAVESPVLTVGPVHLDESRRDVKVAGRRIAPTMTEFRLLKGLMRAGERVLSRDELIDVALGTDVAVTDRTIDVHVAALRKKLGDAAAWIRTVRGAGYAFRDPADDLQ